MRPSATVSPILTQSSLPAKPKLLDRVRWHFRAGTIIIANEESYVDLDFGASIWSHTEKRHPDQTGEAEIAYFLSHLANDRNVWASTQNQAFSALLFLYQQVLERKLEFILRQCERVARPARMPVVLTKEEVRAVLKQMSGELRLMAELLSGSGLRLDRNACGCG